MSQVRVEKSKGSKYATSIRDYAQAEKLDALLLVLVHENEGSRTPTKRFPKVQSTAVITSPGADPDIETWRSTFTARCKSGTSGPKSHSRLGLAQDAMLVQWMEEAFDAAQATKSESEFSLGCCVMTDKNRYRDIEKRTEQGHDTSIAGSWMISQAPGQGGESAYPVGEFPEEPQYEDEVRDDNFPDRY